VSNVHSSAPSVPDDVFAVDISYLFVGEERARNASKPHQRGRLAHEALPQRGSGSIYSMRAARVCSSASHILYNAACFAMALISPFPALRSLRPQHNIHVRLRITLTRPHTKQTQYTLWRNNESIMSRRRSPSPISKDSYGSYQSMESDRGSEGFDSEDSDRMAARATRPYAAGCYEDVALPERESSGDEGYITEGFDYVTGARSQRYNETPPPRPGLAPYEGSSEGEWYQSDGWKYSSDVSERRVRDTDSESSSAEYSSDPGEFPEEKLQRTASRASGKFTRDGLPQDSDNERWTGGSCANSRSSGRQGSGQTSDSDHKHEHTDSESHASNYRREERRRSWRQGDMKH
jgi:hypothetical protein